MLGMGWCRAQLALGSWALGPRPETQQAALCLGSPGSLDVGLPSREGSSRAGLGAVRERRGGEAIPSAEARCLEAGTLGPRGLRGVLLTRWAWAGGRGTDLLLPGLLVSDGAFDWGDFSLE